MKSRPKHKLKNGRCTRCGARMWEQLKLCKPTIVVAVRQRSRGELMNLAMNKEDYSNYINEVALRVLRIHGVGDEGASEWAGKQARDAYYVKPAYVFWLAVADRIRELTRYMVCNRIRF